MRADVEISPTATTQEHKRTEDAPSATQLITAHNAVKAKPRAARSLLTDGRGACLGLTSKSTKARSVITAYEGKNGQTDSITKPHAVCLAIALQRTAKRYIEATAYHACIAAYVRCFFHFACFVL